MYFLPQRFIALLLLAAIGFTSLPSEILHRLVSPGNGSASDDSCQSKCGCPHSHKQVSKSKDFSDENGVNNFRTPIDSQHHSDQCTICRFLAQAVYFQIPGPVIVVERCPTSNIFIRKTQWAGLSFTASKARGPPGRSI